MMINLSPISPHLTPPLRHDFLKQMYRYMVISFGDNGLASYGKRMEIDLVDGEDGLTNGMCVNMYGLKGELTLPRSRAAALLAHRPTRHPRLTTSAMNAINSLTDSLPNELSGHLGNICSLITHLSRARRQPRM